MTETDFLYFTVSWLSFLCELRCKRSETSNISTKNVFNCIINALEMKSKQTPSREDSEHVDYFMRLAHLSNNLGQFEPALVFLSLSDKELEVLKSADVQEDIKEY